MSAMLNYSHNKRLLCFAELINRRMGVGNWDEMHAYICQQAFIYIQLFNKRLKTKLSRRRDAPKDQSKRGHLLCMDYRKLASHVRGMYPTQDTSCTGTADTRKIARKNREINQEK